MNLIVSSLCIVFDTSFNLSIFPESSALAKIVHVFKPGDKFQLSNYRPISLLPVLSQITEKLELIRLNSFLTKQNIINTKSCPTLLSTLSTSGIYSSSRHYQHSSSSFSAKSFKSILFDIMVW